MEIMFIKLKTRLKTHKVENSVARDFVNVTVYVSNLWDDVQNASVSNFYILNGKAEYLVGNIVTPLVKGKLIAIIPKLDREYLVSFDVYLNTNFDYWQSVIHFTIGKDYSKPGDRTPAIYFCDYYGLQINFPRNDIKAIQIYASLKLKLWTKIEVYQFTLNKTSSIITCRINGDVIYSEINNQPVSFNSVKVYASDPWTSVLDGSIKNLFVINGVSSSETQPIIMLPTDHINHKMEFAVVGGLFLGTLYDLKKVYSVSFNIKPTVFSKGLKNVLYLNMVNNSNLNVGKSLGIWFHEDGSGKLVISGYHNNCIETQPLMLGHWSNIKIYQSFRDNSFWFTVNVNGVNIHKSENIAPEDFKNVKVYASNSWDNAQNCLISDLLIFNGKPEYLVDNIVTPLVKGKVAALIPKLDKEYLIVFDIIPGQYLLGLHSVIHFTIGGNMERYGDRSPAIWFSDDGKGLLLIASAISSNLNRFFYTSSIHNYSWSNIDISQNLQHDDYVYTIRINGEVVYSVINYQPEFFNNIKVYASNPWDKVQDGSINNFFVVNGNSNNEAQPIIILPAEYIYQKEVILTQGLILGMLYVLKKVYTVSFSLKPITYSKGLKSVFLLTSNNNSKVYDSGSLSVWFHEDGSGKIYICSEINGNRNYKVETKPLSLDSLYSIKISQYLQSNKYWFTIDINGVNIFKVVNSDARDFKNMRVYASNPWDSVQDCVITDLFIINGKAEYIVGSIPTPLVYGSIVAKIPYLDKVYFISLDVYPKKFASSRHNVIHFTIGSDQFKYGDRVPGVWFDNDGIGKLYIAAPINGNLDSSFVTNPINLDIWSNIRISQFYNGSFYVYTIILNEECVHTQVNNKPESFSDVKVYASDPWSIAQDGLIKNLFIINGDSSNELPPVVFNSVSSPTFSSNSTSSTKKTLIIAIAASVSTLFIILLSVVIIKIYRKKVESIQQSKKWDFIYKSNLNCDQLSADDWEIFPENFTLVKKIGEGAFGTVFAATINSEFLSKRKSMYQKPETASLGVTESAKVAVKLLKDSADQTEYNDFYEEINLMKGIGYHKNIVNMIGCSTSTKPLCLIVELMENGDLLNYLRKRRTKTTVCENQFSKCMPNEIPLDEIRIITPEDLLSFAWQVASGMCIEILLQGIYWLVLKKT
ncbi:uncharacterized protein LOC100199805 isoform X2 [Hydra vulgaris]|uniref:uncharacterized protein LOC100199805 isoform X2 n=1 Tax=Hydra vulgaris TaxID=6087 RepID=UPI0032EA5EB3